MRDPYQRGLLKARRLVHGKGINDSDYVTLTKETTGYTPDGKQIQRQVWMCPFYRCWKNLITRVYGQKSLKRSPTYTGCKVCDEWLTFSNFKAWMEKQDYEGKQLDKDLLVSGNKVYSPGACVFVPIYVNTALGTCASVRGDYPIGVQLDKAPGRYAMRMSRRGKQFCGGVFNTPEEAHKAWQVQKVRVLESVIEDYSKESCFRTDVADALMNRVWKLRLDASMGVETKQL